MNKWSSHRTSNYGWDIPGSNGVRRKDRREKQCIAKGLAHTPQGALVLDLPCGTGRMYSLLKDLGYRVVSADSSEYMVEFARQRVECSAVNENHLQDNCLVADILQTDFADKQFDAVICNRLFHHFSEPQTRQKALLELKRICTGPIIVSFFSNIG